MPSAAFFPPKWRVVKWLTLAETFSLRRWSEKSVITVEKAQRGVWLACMQTLTKAGTCLCKWNTWKVLEKVTEGVWFLAPGLCESSPGPYHGRVKKNTDPWKAASILIFAFRGMTSRTLGKSTAFTIKTLSERQSTELSVKCLVTVNMVTTEQGWIFPPHMDIKLLTVTEKCVEFSFEISILNLKNF